jgi:hypothetical protein
VTLGTLYLKGHGVEKDYYAALELFFQAAAEGEAQAQYQLGRMYADGLGVLRDARKATRWLQAAAAQDHAEARASLTQLKRDQAITRSKYPSLIRGSRYNEYS